MNTIRLAKILMGVAALTIGGVVTTQAAAQTTLKWAHAYEASEPFHTEAVWAAQEIERRTNGRYHIDVYPASQLGSETNINQGLTLGTIDIILTGSSFTARSFPRIGVSYYPYTFRSPAHLLAYIESDVFRELADGYEAKTGHHITAASYYGTRHTTSNRPFSTCAEMKGLKIRVPDVAAFLGMPRACGTNPAPIAFAEVYLALQNGTVDAQENPLPTIEAKRFFEVQKHLILTGHISAELLTVVSRNLWTRLSDEDKQIFSEVMRTGSGRASQQVIDRERELIEIFRNYGLTVTEVDVDEYRRTVLEKIPFESFGYERSDWERIQAVKE